ncbi:PREDICTED: uncharacterized protein LOC105558320 isoform X2 [Vollenhovia emeryi]|uniref:uncharacterized protein LOC105558320 isoform X2 n=1 Tax=Vollenhovia emeryi TaxID=411798 RepID=UPI0005F57FCB|nr:PREDICTED: uncharacterized protein LOC105558320 isoform X2 [Vollenhovia emeryi]
MFAPESKYYNVNRLLLLICGLWPYQKSKLRNIQATFYLTILFSFIVLQLTTFISADCTINLVTKVLSIVLPIFVAILKHGAFFYNNQRMKDLTNLMWYHWTILRDKQEIAILKKYTKFSRRFTIYLLRHILPVILDILVPLNSSRPRHFYILIECSIDEERYFFWLLLHTVVTLSTAMMMMVSVGTMFMSYICHACAMFKIASYRIRDAITENAKEGPSFQKDHAIYKNVISGVRIQKKAIEFADMIVSDLKGHFFVLLSVGVASLAVNLFQVFIALSTKNINELFTTFTFVAAQFCYLYLGNYAGQIVTDHYSEVFDATYDSYWYITPLRVQRLLLFIMQRTSKNFSFVFGGIFVVSLKGFSSVINAIDSLKWLHFKFYLKENYKFTACEHVNILLYGDLFHNFEIIFKK